MKHTEARANAALARTAARTTRGANWTQAAPQRGNARAFNRVDRIGSHAVVAVLCVLINVIVWSI